MNNFNDHHIYDRLIVDLIGWAELRHWEGNRGNLIQWKQSRLSRGLFCAPCLLAREDRVRIRQKRVENKSGRLAVTSVFAALTSFSCEKAWERKKRRGFMSDGKELRLVCGCSSTRARTPFSQSATFVADMRHKLTFSTLSLLFFSFF